MNVTFSGSVSAQVSDGQTVTITVTLPDGTTETLTAKTLVDQTFSVSKEYVVVGDYSAVAHVDEDAQYLATDSPPVTFTIAKQSRTLTLTVNVA